MTDKKRDLIKNIIIGIISSILATLIISSFVKMYNSYNSIYGAWDIEEDYSGEFSDTISFFEDGSFLDGSLGATYSAEDGKLIIFYNPLAGTYTYEYEIKNRELYIYRRGNLLSIYRRR